MKSFLLFPVFLFSGTLLLAQNQNDSDRTAAQCKAKEEVHSVHQSLALAYVFSANPGDSNVFYADDFFLLGKGGKKLTRQHLEERLQGMVKEGILSFESIQQGDMQLRIEEDTAVVRGIWQILPMTTIPVRYESQHPYTFTYTKQNGSWKLASAELAPATQPLLTNQNARSGRRPR